MRAKPNTWYPQPRPERSERTPSTLGRPHQNGVASKSFLRPWMAIEAYQRNRLSGMTHADAVQAAAAAVGRSEGYVRGELVKWHGAADKHVARVEVGQPLPPVPGVRMGPTYSLSFGPRPEYENQRETKAAADFDARKRFPPN
jgi:hypothetical protein